VRLPAKTAIALHDAEPVVFRGSATLRAVTRLPSSSSHSFNTSEQDVLQRWVELTQYTSVAFGSRCHEMGVRPSMGTVGDAYDNAMAESFFATLECELLNRRSWKSKAEARTALFTWIEGWYNPRRRHSALGYLSPIAFEEKHAAHSPDPVTA